MAVVDPFRIVHDLREVTDELLVGVSGKDSVACLELLHSHQKPFRRIQGFFMYLVPGLSFQERYMRYLERRYSISILRLPHWQLGDMLQGGSYRPITAAATECPPLTIAKMEGYLRERTGIGWIVGGHKITDSLLRRLQVGLHHGIDVAHKRAFPLAYWTNSSVYTFLRSRGVALPPDYGIYPRGRSFGDLMAHSVGPIKKHFPEDYAKIKEWFPYVDATFIGTEYADEPAAVHPENDSADSGHTGTL